MNIRNKTLTIHAGLLIDFSEVSMVFFSMEQNSPNNQPQQEEQKQPPNLFQRALKVLTYPFAALAAAFYGHNTSRKNIEEYFKERGDFKHLDDKLANDHAELKTKYNNVIPKEEIGRLSKEYAEGKTTVLHDAGFKRTWNYFKENTRSEKSKAVASGLGAAGIVIGIGSFLSQQQSHERHVAERRERKEDQQTQR